MFAWAKHEVERKTGGSLVQLPAEFVLRPDHIVDVLLPRLAVTFDADAQMIRKGDRVGLNKDGKLILSDAPIGIAMSNAFRGEIVAVQMLSYPVIQSSDAMGFDKQGDKVLGLREATVEFLENSLQKEYIAVMDYTIRRIHEWAGVPAHLIEANERNRSDDDRVDALAYGLFGIKPTAKPEFLSEWMGSWVDCPTDPISDIKEGVKRIKENRMDIKVRRGERVQVGLTEEERKVRLLFRLGIVDQEARELLNKLSYEELSQFASKLRTLSIDLDAHLQSMQEAKHREQYERELRERQEQYEFEHKEVTRKLKERQERQVLCQHEESDEPDPWKDW